MMPPCKPKCSPAVSNTVFNMPSANICNRRNTRPSAVEEEDVEEEEEEERRPPRLGAVLGRGLACDTRN